jgi:hypothetical protein
MIIKILVGAEVIPRDYTGQVILHVGSGGLCNVEKRDKAGLIDQLRGMNERRVLDILANSCNNSV